MDPRSRMHAVIYRPVHPATLGLFRITLGVAMLYEFDTMRGYVMEQLAHSRFFMTYDYFHWVRMLSPGAMSAVFAAGTAAALALTAGLFTRAAAAVVFVTYAYIFLLDKGHYNNHYYLFCLLTFLSIFLDLGKWGSIDAARGKWRASPFAPAWQIHLLRAQIFIVYFYGGLAKLNADWFRGFPMRIWLPQRADYAVVGPLLESPWTAYFFSYAGLAFDLGVGFVLLSRRWRVWALPAILFFHVTNHFIWSIGAFPWFMIAATSLFFDPDWPVRAIETWFGEAAERREREAALAAARPLRGPVSDAVLVGALSAYIGFQALFPLRHLAYAGDSAWNGRGTFFAWHMMLDDRYDAVRVRIEIPGEGPVGNLDLKEYVNSRQFKKIGWDPSVFVHLARFVEKEMAAKAGIADAAVYVDAFKSLNGRPYTRLIDPEADLTLEDPAWYAERRYVLPLDPALEPSATAPAPPPSE